MSPTAKVAVVISSGRPIYCAPLQVQSRHYLRAGSHRNKVALALLSASAPTLPRALWPPHQHNCKPLPSPKSYYLRADSHRNKVAMAVLHSCLTKSKVAATFALAATTTKVPRQFSHSSPVTAISTLEAWAIQAQSLLKALYQSFLWSLQAQLLAKCPLTATPKGTVVPVMCLHIKIKVHVRPKAQWLCYIPFFRVK
jgi:hypothetical protein